MFQIRIPEINCIYILVLQIGFLRCDTHLIEISEPVYLDQSFSLSYLQALCNPPAGRHHLDRQHLRMQFPLFLGFILAQTTQSVRPIITVDLFRNERALPFYGYQKASYGMHWYNPLQILFLS